METATSDRLVDRLSLSGTPDEEREKARAFEGIIPHLLLHPPAIPPLTAAESRESFEAILETFGPASHGGADLSAATQLLHR